MNLCKTTYNISLKPITFCQWRLVIGHRQLLLTFPQLLQLREEINCITTEENLLEIIEDDNFILLFIADRQHLVYLEIPQLLDLKALITYVFE